MTAKRSFASCVSSVAARAAGQQFNENSAIAKAIEISCSYYTMTARAWYDRPIRRKQIFDLRICEDTEIRI